MEQERHKNWGLDLKQNELHFMSLLKDQRHKSQECKLNEHRILKTFVLIGTRCNRSSSKAKA